MTIVDMHEPLAQYAGPGNWNDPDMLEVGNGQTASEDRTHFSIWCMMAAPLMAGNDIRKMSQQTLDILTNKDAIAIDQDKLGIQGSRYINKDSLQVWFKPLENGDWAVCFVNRSSKVKKVSFNWKKEEVKDKVTGRSLDAGAVKYTLFDVWSKKTVGTTKSKYSATLQPHETFMYRLRK